MRKVFDELDLQRATQLYLDMYPALSAHGLMKGWVRDLDMQESSDILVTARFDSFRTGLGEFPGHLDQRNHSRKPLKILRERCGLRQKESVAVLSPPHHPPFPPRFPPISRDAHARAGRQNRRVEDQDMGETHAEGAENPRCRVWRACDLSHRRSGVVNLDWADRLAGLKISTVSRGEHPAHSTLEGPIRDQDELNGVLETLCGLHLPIFKVEKTEARATEA